MYIQTKTQTSEYLLNITWYRSTLCCSKCFLILVWIFYWSLFQIIDCCIVSHKPLTGLSLTHFQLCDSKRNKNALKILSAKCCLLCSVYNMLWADPRYQGSCDQHGAHLGPVGPKWAPYWPHELCYQGCHAWLGPQMAMNVSRFVINLHVYTQSVWLWMLYLFHCSSIAAAAVR